MAPGKSTRTANNTNNKSDILTESLKGALLVLRQFLAAETSLKIMKNALYLTLKTFLFSIFNFLSWLSGHVEKRLD